MKSPLSQDLINAMLSSALHQTIAPARKVQSRTRQTQEKIKQAAKFLFVKHGFDGTSMGDVAEKAEINQSLIHHHFGSKQALWNVIRDEIYEGYVSAALEFLSQESDQDIQIQIQSLIRMRFKFIQDHPELARIMAWQTLSDMPASTTSDHGMLAMQKVLDRLKTAQQNQLLSQEIAPEMIAVVVFISTIGWFQNDYRWLFSKQLNMSESELDQKYLDSLSKILLGGVLA